jgi:uncharacterized protein DUF5343
MAEAEAQARKTSYPMLSPMHWWKLRKKFRQSIPGIVTDSYVATVLDMQVNSARANVMPFLKSLGLIDADGKPLERVKQWRDDEQYAVVCREIIKEVYPEELTHAITDPRNDKAKTERWFASQCGVGESAAGKMAAMYTILVEADPTKEVNGPAKAPALKKTAPKAEAGTKRQSTAAKTVSSKPEAHGRDDHDLDEHMAQRKHGQSIGPDVNINLQIHISADASPDQIEQIFVSMAKHLYKNG